METLKVESGTKLKMMSKKRFSKFRRGTYRVLKIFNLKNLENNYKLQRYYTKEVIYTSKQDIMDNYIGKKKLIF